MGFEDFQNNERGVFRARTNLTSREAWYAAGAVRYGTQQDKLRGNRRGVALSGWSLSCVQPIGITTMLSHSTAKSYPSCFKFSRSRAFARPVLGKRNYRHEVKLRLNRQGMALRERNAPCVLLRLTWGRHRRGSAPVFISVTQSHSTPSILMIASSILNRNKYR